MRMTNATVSTSCGRTVVLLVLLVAGAVLPGPQVVAQDAEEDVLVDLPAMTLTPADLEAVAVEGYGVSLGATRYLDETVAFLAEDQDLPEDQVRDALEDAGFVRWYESALNVAENEEFPAGNAARTISSSVLEFADDEGAADDATRWVFQEREPRQ